MNCVRLGTPCLINTEVGTSLHFSDFATYRPSESHWGKMQMGGRRKTLRRVGQHVRRCERWVLSGVRDVTVSDAFNWPV
jgi:hypothetical protein